jgi:hypothetical protein
VILGLESATNTDISTGGSALNFTGASINLTSSLMGLNAGEGSGQPGARIGDSVLVNPEIGVGVITTGSATVLLGE